MILAPSSIKNKSAWECLVIFSTRQFNRGVCGVWGLTHIVTLRIIWKNLFQKLRIWGQDHHVWIRLPTWSQPWKQRGEDSGYIVARRVGIRYQRLRILTSASINETFTTPLKERWKLWCWVYQDPTPPIDPVPSSERRPAYAGFRPMMSKLWKYLPFDPEAPSINVHMWLIWGGLVCWPRLNVKSARFGRDYIFLQGAFSEH